MPIGHHIAKCHACLKEFVCGDCIPSTCPECFEKGHRDAMHCSMCDSETQERRDRIDTAIREKLEARIAELERERDKAYQRGMEEGRSAQAILEVQGRQKFLETVKLAASPLEVERLEAQLAAARETALREAAHYIEEAIPQQGLARQAGLTTAIFMLQSLGMKEAQRAADRETVAADHGRLEQETTEQTENSVSSAASCLPTLAEIFEAVSAFGKIRECLCNYGGPNFMRAELETVAAALAGTKGDGETEGQSDGATERSA